eukprot:g9380.t1
MLPRRLRSHFHTEEAKETDRKRLRDWAAKQPKPQKKRATKKEKAKDNGDKAKGEEETPWSPPALLADRGEGRRSCSPMASRVLFKERKGSRDGADLAPAIEQKRAPRSEEAAGHGGGALVGVGVGSLEPAGAGGSPASPGGAAGWQKRRASILIPMAVVYLFDAKGRGWHPEPFRTSRVPIRLPPGVWWSGCSFGALGALQPGQAWKLRPAVKEYARGKKNGRSRVGAQRLADVLRDVSAAAGGAAPLGGSAEGRGGALVDPVAVFPGQLFAGSTRLGEMEPGAWTLVTMVETPARRAQWG